MPSPAAEAPTKETPEARERVASLLKDERMQKMHRQVTLNRQGIDKEKRTVELSFASEEPVERWFGREILDISKEACDLSRLNGGGAILVNHDWDDQVGVCLEASIDPKTGKARCVAKFSSSQRGQDIFNDIADGIRSLVSVGYIVRKMVLQSVEGDVETHRVTDWQPYEVSIVSVPADPSVGVGRAHPAMDEAKAAPATAVERTQPTPTMSTPAPAAPASTPAASSPVDHLARMKEINAAAKTLSERHPGHAEALRNLAAKCAETGDGIDVFNRTVVNDILGTKQEVAPVRQDPDAAKLGLKGRDLSRYSVLRAARLVCDGKGLDGIERECNDELTRKLGRQPQGFFVPDEVFAHRRTLTAGVPGDGGYTVGQQMLVSEFENYLRNNAVVLKLGGRYISGLVGDVTIPRQLTGASAYWVSETGSITQSGATFGQIVGKPRRIGTSVPYSKQWVAQTSLDAEAFVVNDSDQSIAVDLDRVALRGVGGAEPLGIANMATADRSTSVTFGAAPTWAKYLEFFSSVAANNAIVNNPAYVASVASAVKAMATAKFSNTGIPIWEDGKVGAFRAEWTTQLLTSATPVANMVIFGDFSQVLFLEWAGRDVVVDPYSGKKEGNVEITIQRLMDVVIRRGKSFAISTDSGAQ
jgi:HK97 family phage major capsid protein